MAQLLPPPTPNRDFSREEDSDSDVSEDSAGACFYTIYTFHIKPHILCKYRKDSLSTQILFQYFGSDYVLNHYDWLCSKDELPIYARLTIIRIDQN